MADSVYDNTITFHPTGEIKPLAYIKNTIDLGSPKFILTTNNFGLIATINDPNGNKRLFTLNENAIHTFSGTTNDGTLIIHNLLQKLAKQSVFQGVIEYENIYDEISLASAKRTISQSRLISAVSSTVYRKKNEEGKYKFHMLECDPFGEVYEYVLNATGHRSASVLSVMEKEDLQDRSVEDVLLRVKECFRSVFSTDLVDAIVLDKDGIKEFTV